MFFGHDKTQTGAMLTSPLWWQTMSYHFGELLLGGHVGRGLALTGLPAHDHAPLHDVGPGELRRAPLVERGATHLALLPSFSERLDKPFLRAAAGRTLVEAMSTRYRTLDRDGEQRLFDLRSSPAPSGHAPATR